jgi:hypothetical protein
MLDRLDETLDERIKALGDIERDKLRLSRAYNKKIKKKSFQVGDLFWKMILPIGSKSNKFGKWSPNWEGPYRIEEVIPKNSYMVQSIQGTSLPRALNEKSLKKVLSLFGTTLELEMTDNEIIALAQKWLMKHHEHRPQVKFGLKCLLIRKLN